MAGAASAGSATFRASADTVAIRPVSLGRRLPVVGIPLRTGEADVPLDLQVAFDRTYTEARFRSLDYARPPDPPLSDAEAAWVAELLRQPR